MAILIGTDEAGYGPNLGPLLISASVWRIPDQDTDADLYQLLSPVVTTESTRNGNRERITVCDSKELYSSGSTLAGLERTIHPLMRVCGHSIRTWRDCWQLLAADSMVYIDELPWYCNFDCELPRDIDDRLVDDLTELIRQQLLAKDVQLLAVRSRAVFPEPFNDQADQLGSKGALLSQETVGLVVELLKEFGGEPTLVSCDKHGGRNRYSPILQQFIPDTLIEIHGESRQQSVYRWGNGDDRTEMRFCARGESFMPSAVASIACKYLRELAMEAFNDYWCREVDGVRRTAGYPVDAKRFKSEIQTRQWELAIDDRILWRNR